MAVLEGGQRNASSQYFDMSCGDYIICVLRVYSWRKREACQGRRWGYIRLIDNFGQCNLLATLHVQFSKNMFVSNLLAYLPVPKNYLSKINDIPKSLVNLLICSVKNSMLVGFDIHTTRLYVHKILPTNNVVSGKHVGSLSKVL